VQKCNAIINLNIIVFLILIHFNDIIHQWRCFNKKKCKLHLELVKMMLMERQVYLLLLVFPKNSMGEGDGGCFVHQTISGLSRITPNFSHVKKHHHIFSFVYFGSSSNWKNHVYQCRNDTKETIIYTIQKVLSSLSK
jgi:hypothetical protein